jgi:predicted TIM-barrel enzyme
MCRSEMTPSMTDQARTHNRQDAVLAAEAGVDGVLISNHGGELFSR